MRFHSARLPPPSTQELEQRLDACRPALTAGPEARAMAGGGWPQQRARYSDVYYRMMKEHDSLCVAGTLATADIPIFLAGLDYGARKATHSLQKRALRLNARMGCDKDARELGQAAEILRGAPDDKQLSRVEALVKRGEQRAEAMRAAFGRYARNDNIPRALELLRDASDLPRFLERSEASDVTKVMSACLAPAVFARRLKKNRLACKRLGKGLSGVPDLEPVRLLAQQGADLALPDADGIAPLALLRAAFDQPPPHVGRDREAWYEACLRIPASWDDYLDQDKFHLLCEGVTARAASAAYPNLRRALAAGMHRCLDAWDGPGNVAALRPFRTFGDGLVPVWALDLKDAQSVPLMAKLVAKLQAALQGQKWADLDVLRKQRWQGREHAPVQRAGVGFLTSGAWDAAVKLQDLGLFLALDRGIEGHQAARDSWATALDSAMERRDADTTEKLLKLRKLVGSAEAL